MSGAPSDSYGHGLFRTASAGNLSRRWKALRRRGKLPKKLTKRDEVAELLSQGFELDAIAERMRLTAKAVRSHFDAIRKQLGPQAV